MSKPTPERVSITIQPVAGDERDTFEVAFLGADGSRAQGTELTLAAGKVGTWEITCTVAEAVSKGGGFLFQRHTFLFSHRIQDYNSQGRDYVTLEAHTDADIRLIVNSLRQSHQPGFAQVVVEWGELRPGDRFTIRVGDRSGGGAGSEVYDGATLGRILGAVDRDGSGMYRELACNPATILITSEPVPRLLRVLGPSIVPPGEPFNLNLIVFDPNHNVCEQYTGEIALAAGGPTVENLPSSVRFGPDEGGLVVLEGIRIGEPGLFRFTASDPSHGLSAKSNPILCQEDFDRRLLWGNLHCHGTGDINMALMDDLNFKIHPARRHEQLRRVGREDFGAAGPAVPPNLEDRPELWQIYQQVYRDNDEPGTYVPFLAAETHPRPGGDRNVIFREMTDSYHPTFCRMDEVMGAYADREDVLLEAHVGGGPPDWNAYPTEREPLLEVASGHGSFEWVLQRALDHGHRPAIIGSEDTHLCTMGAPMAAHSFFGRHQHHLNMRDTGFGSGPVAAVWANRCERHAIWDAIRERRTYATTGARIILDVSVNGAPAGSEIEGSGSVPVRIQAHACVAVERVDLIRNDRCLQSWYPASLDVDLAHVDGRPVREGAYYVRLRQTDGEYAWSTPVWVGCADGDEVPDQALPMWNAHEPVDLSSLRPNEAEPYEADLRRYLEIEEDPDLFQDITPVKIVEEITGRSALFYCYHGPDREPLSIRWYFEFEMPRLHLDWGWRDFGMRSTPRRIGSKRSNA